MAALAVREPRAGYGETALPPESVLSRLWAGQRIPEEALVTTAGERVRVLHPGVAGRGAGPDFRHARVELAPGVVRFGDVELHVRATDFRAHGHHRDHRYDNVILHVVFVDDIGTDTLLASGTRTPVVALAPPAQERAEELTAWLRRPERFSEPCRHAVARLGQDRVLARLDALGDARFAERREELICAIEGQGAGQTLFCALARAALAGSPETAGRLSSSEIWEAVRAAFGSALGLEAVLLGSPGFLDMASAPLDEHELALAGCWADFGLEGHAEAPSPEAQRPANHPARRLAGLARLLVRHRPLLSNGAGDVVATGFEVKDWTVASAGYWNTHVAPGLAARRSPGALIGRSRAIELLVNAVLPWSAAVATLRDDELLGHRVGRAYEELPAPERYGRLGFLERNLWGDERRLPLTARRQQGLLALYKHECTQGGCGRCPFS